MIALKIDKIVKIRLANSDDAELLAALGRETFRDAFAGNPLMPQEDLRLYLDSAFTVSQTAADLRDPKIILLLAEINGEAAAYARLDCGVTTEGVTGQHPIKLKRLYCKQKFIGFGVGASLMRRCLDEANVRNRDTMWLTVWKHNKNAQNFYRKWNFTECGTFEFQLGETSFLDILMLRNLAADNTTGISSAPQLS